MSSGDRAGLIARIRQVRRLAVPRDRPAADANDPRSDQLRGMEKRLAHLERLVEGLQDSVYRESERHAKLIADLQSQVEPGAMGSSLADDARKRGL